MQTSDIVELLRVLAYMCDQSAEGLRMLDSSVLTQAAEEIIGLRQKVDELMAAYEEKSKEFEAMYHRYCWMQQ